MATADSPKPATASSPGRHLPDVRPEYLALGFLVEERMHGYDLHRRYEAILGRVWHISQSQMYSILKRLEAQALVESCMKAGKGPPARRMLSATPEGRRHFGEWLMADTDCSSRFMRMEFIARLCFAKRSKPASLNSIIESQKAAIERHLSNHRSLLGTLDESDGYNRLSLELRIRQLSAIREWMEGDVEKLSLTGGE